MAQETRERILEVARELFTEQGYDGTSLREIADRLGFTKAALYYHFQGKDQILLALLEPAQNLVSDLLGQLEKARGPKEWGDTLCWVVGQMSSNMALFRLLQRNRGAIEQVGGWPEAMNDHKQMHERVEQAVIDMTPSRREQVRMIAALGAVTGFDDWAPTLIQDIPMAELQAELTAVVRDILGTSPDDVDLDVDGTAPQVAATG